MNIIYKTTDTLNDLSYIGSKMNYVEKSDYLGSPSCKVGHPKYKVQQLFLETVKNHRDAIIFEILEIVDGQDVKKVRERETFWQKKFDATQSPKFINGIYANATGRTCKKLFCIDIHTEEILEFNSIKECEETLSIQNVGAVVLGKRPSTSNKVCITEDEYYNNQSNIIAYVKNRYEQLLMKDRRLKTEKTILNIQTKETVQCSANKVAFLIKELGWSRKLIFVYTTYTKDKEYINLIQNSIKSFTQRNLQKLKILDELTGEIISYEELYKLYGNERIKFHIQGINKTLNGRKFKITE